MQISGLGQIQPIKSHGIKVRQERNAENKPDTSNNSGVSVNISAKAKELNVIADIRQSKADAAKIQEQLTHVRSAQDGKHISVEYVNGKQIREAREGMNKETSKNAKEDLDKTKVDYKSLLSDLEASQDGTMLRTKYVNGKEIREPVEVIEKHESENAKEDFDKMKVDYKSLLSDLEASQEGTMLRTKYVNGEEIREKVDVIEKHESKNAKEDFDNVQVDKLLIQEQVAASQKGHQINNKYVNGDKVQSESTPIGRSHTSHASDYNDKISNEKMAGAQLKPSKYSQVYDAISNL